MAVVEETEEEEGAALFPLSHALNFLHVALAPLDVGASLERLKVVKSSGSACMGSNLRTSQKLSIQAVV